MDDAAARRLRDFVILDDASAKRLRDFVAARMGQLGRSRRQVSLRGGPTEPTMLKIEREQARRLEPETLRRLNVGLDCEPGSAENVIAGRQPTPKRGGTDIAVGPPAVEVPVDTITALVAAAAEINRLAQSEAPAMQQAAEHLDAAVQPLYSRYITQLLEANHRQQGALGPLVALLGPFLDRPIDPDQEDDEEPLYRRWLAGMCPDLDDATTMRFRARLEGSR
ncbi:hypothetical protein [Nocardia amamiensis]|uniref:hypothetical protein n=1 Tax=Nocardia amamiensis TaxID=404578 RepID=UPI00082EAC0A|nr:hypothetical protein [Nocardia amamiensis]